ncbi:MAG: indolepyruvate oxidoreductase subunit beta [Candidatus Pacebacteria bacterium]|nr:indolepyruvate oxidoreductase subunit beta [Candidatus Paceibacterota bacterium]
MDKNGTFNIIVVGVGGQGLMTLLKIISQAAFDAGLDVKTSELHGLSQRGGSVSVYIRFGEKVFSPLVPQGQADLILALEQQESLNGLYFANKKTVFLINQQETPTMAQTADKAEIEQELKKVVRRAIFLPASNVCQKELGSDVFSGVYLLGYAAKKGFLPFKREELESAVRETMPEKYWESNLKALELAGH